MKKIIILLIGILLLSGCDKIGNLKTYCDEEYGIEYLRDEGTDRGGITVRLDKNGNVIHCK